MFVGHLALAFASKPLSRTTSLGWFMAAVTTSDLLWPLFLLAGLEHVRIVQGATLFNPMIFDSYPWSHSLVMTFVWGLVLAALARLVAGVERRGLILIWLLVVSHWVLDFMTHAPDMPLWPGPSPLLGLSLWNSIPGTLIVEGLMWIVSLAIFLRRTRAKNWVSILALWSFVFICTVMWAFSPWSPPPPNEKALALFAFIGWITVPWSIWIDRGYVRKTANGSS
jgi:hypothetical protein